MSTRQKINLRKKDNQILELKGNLFQVEPYYRLYLDFPFRLGTMYLTKDLYTNETFNLIHTSNDHWYCVTYKLELDMYLLRKLTWLEYKPEIDIKNTYIYGRKKNHKIS